MECWIKNFQNPYFKTGAWLNKMTYESSRDYVINLASQKAQLAKPLPAEVNELAWGMPRPGEGIGIEGCWGGE